MSVKAKWRMLVDSLMVVLIPLLMAYSLIGETAHEWLGVMMSLLFVGHCLLNFYWFKGLVKGRWTALRIYQTIVNILLLLCTLGLIISGIALSRTVFSFLPIEGGGSWGRTLHLLTSYWGFVLMSFHLGQHWSMILNRVQRSAKRPVILRVLAVAFAGYGIIAFIKREIGTYMTLQNTFVYFDFGEPLFFFFIDYIAIMGLFVFLGYYVTSALKWLNKGMSRER
ncbi:MULTISPECIES: DUF4405 domain-containing protein [Clostridia]|uniref:DUF4405 domain-containing protein n=1 Tax=Clostridia TaxID=186801 RepID=UPI0008485680|nr:MULTISPECIES: DUF4405 domain-containing protein [Clostridia]MDY3617564.1 DUF4405 domain-containing protein [Agathobaculum sp.]ODR33856.1 hypothetical protein BEI60_23445 [Eisenbergiella tayi]